MVTISQSGETLDTMEALSTPNRSGKQLTLAICNVQESAIPRASRLIFYTRAGAEIGVASTKAFTTQLVGAIHPGRHACQTARPLSEEHEREYLEALRHLPGSVQYALNLEPQIREWAKALPISIMRYSWAAACTTLSRWKAR